MFAIGNMEVMILRRGKGWMLALACMLVVLAGMTVWQRSERSFASLTGLQPDDGFQGCQLSINSEGFQRDDIGELVAFFAQYRYQWMSSAQFDFVARYPEGLRTYSITIHPQGRDLVFLFPMEDEIVIGDTLYRVVNGPLDLNFLHAYYARAVAEKGNKT